MRWAIDYRIPVVAAALGVAGLSLWHGRSSEAPVPIIIVAPTLPAPPASRPSSPTRAVPCVGEDVEVLARGSTAVLCSSLGCLDVDNDTGELAPSIRPAPVAVEPASVRDGSICHAQSCKHLGPRLAAAVKGANEIAATADLAAVVVRRDSDQNRNTDGYPFGGSTAWNVAGDHPLHFWLGRKADIGNIAIAGNFLAVNWVHHEEGTWTSTVVYDTHGNPTATDLDGEASIVTIDDSIVIIGQAGHIVLVSATTGKITDRAVVETVPVWVSFPDLVLLPQPRVPRFAVLRKQHPARVVGLSTFSIVGDNLLADLDKQVPLCAP